MRKFVRHPANVPIDITIEEATGACDGYMINISAGGLAFQIPRPVAVGSAVTISLPHIWPDYAAHGHVVWCRQESGSPEAGVQFSEANEAFKARMVAQFCQIEDYRRLMQKNEGRLLSSDEAAREWICRYAEEFADTIGWQ